MRSGKKRVTVIHDPYRSVSPDLKEYLEIHEGKADERENACCEGGVPDLTEGVPVDEVGVPPRLGHLNLPLTRHVGLVEGHLTGAK